MMTPMLVPTVVLHSLLRWLVLAFALVAVFRAFSGVFSRRPWTPLDDRAGRLFILGLDIQTLVGLILYGLLSPITRTAMSDMGMAMKDPLLRFYVVEHLVLMIGAVALAHIGRARLRKATGDLARHRTAAIFFTLTLLLILLGTPWPFRAIGRPLLPHF
jgi:hypothetical protein